MRDALVEARRLGFLGPGELDVHIEHAAGFARAWSRVTRAQQPGRALDLGAGGGVPGLVLAAMWEGTALTLLESNARRAAFLATVIARCGVDGRVRVLQARAEDAGRQAAERGTYDVVVARSFGPPAVTAECAAPFLRVGGLLVTSEPPTVPEAQPGDTGAPATPGRWPADGLAQLGMVPVGPVEAGASFHVVRQVSAAPDRFPRRVGVAAKRPLF